MCWPLYSRGPGNIIKYIKQWKRCYSCYRTLPRLPHVTAVLPHVLTLPHGVTCFTLPHGVTCFTFTARCLFFFLYRTVFILFLYRTVSGVITYRTVSVLLLTAPVSLYSSLTAPVSLYSSLTAPVSVFYSYRTSVSVLFLPHRCLFSIRPYRTGVSFPLGFTAPCLFFMFTAPCLFLCTALSYYLFILSGKGLKALCLKNNIYLCFTEMVTACLFYILCFMFYVLRHGTALAPSVDNNTAPTPLWHRFYSSKRPEPTVTAPCVHTPVYTHPGYTPLHAAATRCYGRVRCQLRSEKTLPPCKKAVYSIYHEITRIRTVKTVYRLDAVVRYWSYNSALTNKEETFLYIRLDASATVSVGRCLTVFYRMFTPLHTVLYLLHTARTVLFYSTKGLFIGSGRFERQKRVKAV